MNFEILNKLEILKIIENALDSKLLKKITNSWKNVEYIEAGFLCETYLKKILNQPVRKKSLNYPNELF